jgi:hypothetical protein
LQNFRHLRPIPVLECGHGRQNLEQLSRGFRYARLDLREGLGLTGDLGLGMVG